MPKFEDKKFLRVILYLLFVAIYHEDSTTLSIKGKIGKLDLWSYNVNINRPYVSFLNKVLNKAELYKNNCAQNSIISSEIYDQVCWKISRRKITYWQLNYGNLANVDTYSKFNQITDLELFKKNYKRMKSLLKDLCGNERIIESNSLLHELSIDFGSLISLNGNKTEFDTDKIDDGKDSITMLKGNLDLFLHDELYEKVVMDLKSTATEKNNIVGLNAIQRINSLLKPLVRKIRRSFYNHIIEQILAAITVNQLAVDSFLSELNMAHFLTKGLINYLDELIRKSQILYGKHDSVTFLGDQGSLEIDEIKYESIIPKNKKKLSVSEYLLLVVKERIIAELELQSKNKILFVKILSQYVRSEENFHAILQKSIRKIEMLEEFETWLIEGIEYAEKEGKLSDQYISKMRKLLEIIKEMNPLYKQFLNRQNDMQLLIPNDYSLDST